MTSGATGTGEFVSYLGSVFGGDPDSITLLSQSLFAFNVPMSKSHFNYHSRGGAARVTGYHGSFRVDPDLAELRRLTIIADQFPAEEKTCSVENAMNYERVKIGDGSFLLPSMATLEILYSLGTESINETRYSGCREYIGEAKIRFDDFGTTSSGPGATRPSGKRVLPPGLRFHIALASPVHSENAAAGDVVRGVVLNEVRDSKLGIVASANDIVHGRIIQLEQYMFPASLWVVSLRFDSIEHDGAEQPIELTSKNGGVFTFRQAGNLALDNSFQSEWETP